MATATPLKAVPVEPEVVGVEVTLSRREALALVALSGHIGGGEDESPRGPACEALQAISEALGFGRFGGYEAAQAELRSDLSGGLTFSPYQ